MASQNNPRYAGVNMEALTKAMRTLSAQSGASGGSTIQQLIDEYTKKTNEANAANEARYAEGKGELTDLRSRVLAQIKNLGISQIGDVNRQFANARSSTLQDLASRGLANSTITPSIMAGLDRQKAEAIGALHESRMMQQLGLDQDTTANLVGFIERRNDVAPSLDTLAQLAMSLGQNTGSSIRLGGSRTVGGTRSGGGYNPLNGLSGKPASLLDGLGGFGPGGRFQVKKSSVPRGQTSIYQAGALAPKKKKASSHYSISVPAGAHYDYSTKYDSYNMGYGSSSTRYA